jgi:hypothetical protein
MTVIATLTEAIQPSATPVTSLTVSALEAAVAAGDELLLQSAGGQGWTQGGVYASASANVGAETITVEGFFPNMYGFAVGDTVSDGTADAALVTVGIPGFTVGTTLASTASGTLPLGAVQNVTGTAHVGEVYFIGAADTAAALAFDFKIIRGGSPVDIGTLTVPNPTDSSVPVRLQPDTTVAIESGDAFEVTITGTMVGCAVGVVVAS